MRERVSTRSGCTSFTNGSAARRACARVGEGLGGRRVVRCQGGRKAGSHWLANALQSKSSVRPWQLAPALQQLAGTPTHLESCLATGRQTQQAKVGWEGGGRVAALHPLPAAAASTWQRRLQLRLVRLCHGILPEAHDEEPLWRGRPGVALGVAAATAAARVWEGVLQAGGTEARELREAAQVYVSYLAMPRYNTTGHTPRFRTCSAAAAGPLAAACAAPPPLPAGAAGPAGERSNEAQANASSSTAAAGAWERQEGDIRRVTAAEEAVRCSLGL